VLTLYSARYSNIDPPTEASSNADQATLIALARNAWIDAVAAGGEALLESHAAAMERLHTPGIEVEGNVTLARVVNASLHALLVSFREDSDQSSAPEGLISTRYSGHAFWDVETWQWPTWLLFWPKQARKVLDYRARLSQQAADNARFPSALPYFNRSDTRIPYPQLEGLRFPWESALTGIEMCPGNGEDHIMGDIATAFRQYYWATQDGDWLNQTGWPVIQGIAQFYASRVTVDPRNASIYHIVGSMGPDEYHGNVTDSAYGNWVARASLLAANRFAPLVDVAPNATFQAIADGLVIPYDATSDYHPEYQGFSPSKSGLIKQADTLLMYYPLAAPQVKAATRRNDVNVYTKQTDPHGPAMTYTIHSIVSLDIGDDEQADGFFRDGFSNFTRAPFYLWHEGTGPEGSSKQGAPNLVTGAGGFLQNVWAGYGGLRFDRDDGALTIRNPRPLPGSSGLKLRGVHFRGARLDIRGDGHGWTVALSSNAGAAPIATDAGFDAASTVPPPLLELVMVDPATGNEIQGIPSENITKKVIRRKPGEVGIVRVSF